MNIYASISTEQGSKFGKSGNKKYERDKTTLILGDTIVKILNSFHQSKSTKSKVAVRSFPGARVRDMYQYIQPTLERTDKRVHVVLHVDTNDLQHKSPQVVADESVDLVRHRENKYPETTACLSDVTNKG